MGSLNPGVLRPFCFLRPEFHLHRWGRIAASPYLKHHWEANALPGLAEVPILTCDGMAAFVFQELRDVTDAEVSVWVPKPPQEVLLGGEAIHFRCEETPGRAWFQVPEAGVDYSLAVKRGDPRRRNGDRRIRPRAACRPCRQQLNRCRSVGATRH